MTVEELAKISQISEKTVRKRYAEVKGADNSGSDIVFPEGSRFPFDIHRYKMNNMSKRTDALLKAVFRFMYIDAYMLSMTEESFQSLIEELLNADLLNKNGSKNNYGANCYDTTLKYSNIAKMETKKRYSVLASMLGTFASAVISGCYS